MTAKPHLRPVPEQGNRAVLYVRVSAVMGRDAEEFHSPAMQVRAMRDLAGRRDLHEVEVIEDIDVSGRTFERAGIRRVLELARARQIDVVALYDLSRLGRNTAESLRTIAELRELGVSVVSTVEQIDDTPEGQFQLGVFLGMAQLYSDQVSRRWREVHAHRASKGLTHGPAPIGYRRVAGRLAPSGEADAVRAVFTGYAAGRLISHLAWEFSAAVGRRTSLTVVKRMLRNPVYVGRVRLAGEVFPGAHEALVSDRTWRAVQRRLERDGHTPSRILSGENPLGGLVRCVECKRPMRLHAQNRATGEVRLRCPGSEVGVCRGPGTPLVADVEAAVVAKIRAEYGGLELRPAAAAERRAARARATVDVRRLRGEVARLDAALGAAAADLYRSRVTDDEHRAAVKLLREERALLVAQLDGAERASAALPATRAVKLAHGLLDRWHLLASEEKRRMFRETVEVAWLRRAGRWREPVADRLDVRLL